MGRIVDAARGLEGVSEVTTKEEEYGTALVVTFDLKRIDARKIAKELRKVYENDEKDATPVDRIDFK